MMVSMRRLDAWSLRNTRSGLRKEQKSRDSSFTQHSTALALHPGPNRTRVPSDLTPGAALRLDRYSMMRLRSCLQSMGRFLWHTVNMVWNTALAAASVTLTGEGRERQRGEGDTCSKCPWGLKMCYRHFYQAIIFVTTILVFFNYFWPDFKEEKEENEGRSSRNPPSRLSPPIRGCLRCTAPMLRRHLVCHLSTIPCTLVLGAHAVPASSTSRADQSSCIADTWCLAPVIQTLLLIRHCAVCVLSFVDKTQFPGVPVQQSC